MNIDFEKMGGLVPAIIQDNYTQKVLMLGFVFAAMFAFLAVSNVMGLIDLKPVDYRTTNGNYITVSNPEKSEKKVERVHKK